MKKSSIFDLKDTGGDHFLAGIMRSPRLHAE